MKKLTEKEMKQVQGGRVCIPVSFQSAVGLPSIGALVLIDGIYYICQ
jgi:bacteriocin-like protein